MIQLLVHGMLVFATKDNLETFAAGIDEENKIYWNEEPIHKNMLPNRKLGRDTGVSPLTVTSRHIQ